MPPPQYGDVAGYVGPEELQVVPPANPTLVGTPIHA